MPKSSDLQTLGANVRGKNVTSQVKKAEKVASLGHVEETPNRANVPQVFTRQNQRFPNKIKVLPGM